MDFFWVANGLAQIQGLIYRPKSPLPSAIIPSLTNHALMTLHHMRIFTGGCRLSCSEFTHCKGEFHVLWLISEPHSNTELHIETHLHNKQAIYILKKKIYITAKNIHNPIRFTTLPYLILLWLLEKKPTHKNTIQLFTHVFCLPILTPPFRQMSRFSLFFKIFFFLLFSFRAEHFVCCSPSHMHIAYVRVWDSCAY